MPFSEKRQTIKFACHVQAKVDAIFDDLDKVSGLSGQNLDYFV